MNKSSFFILFISLLAPILPTSIEAAPPVPAFPGAEGWGAQSIGGRGGKVIEVTNLNDTGAGSLRWCVVGFPEEYSGPTNRICVFRIAGVINLKSELQIKRPNITIAGQTAPGDGITLQGAGIRILTHNVIIRYIHWRSATLGFVGFSPWGDVHDVIIDHCSANGHKPKPNIGSGTMIGAWYNDENRINPDIRNITIQNCLFGENMRGVSMLFGGNVDLNVSPPILDNHRVHHISIHRNYFTHADHRNPLIKTPYTEVINNVVYNWGNRIGGTGVDAEVDWINNYWKKGPMSDNRALVFEWLASGTCKAAPLSSIYIAGNIMPSKITDPDQDNWFLFETNQGNCGNEGNPVPKANRRLAQLSPAPYPVTISPALTIVNSVLQDAGANKRLNSDGSFTNTRDEVDQRFVNDFRNGTGPSQTVTTVRLPSSIDPGIAYADFDKDGMSDEWEHLYGFNPKDASDGHQDADGDGYTNVEEFLNGDQPRDPSASISTPEIWEQYTYLLR